MIAPFRAIVVTLCSFAILSGLGLAALVLGYSVKFGKCVKLPNGSELSYEAFVDLGNSFLRPDVVLRDPEGAIIGKEIWPIHITSTATHGTAWPERDNSKPDFSFVWTANTGLVKQVDNPSLYAELLATANSASDYIGAPFELHVNTLWMFKRLSEDERYIGRSCVTQLFTF
ncbi:hypothetical protein HKX54_08060 [Sulfitobacter sp. M57]|uniref:hypothetical protein n=1 Tax=unclassified Sulfitobacter TaxID=196795 RepID=UPI0023E2CC16|nr:MULTISPECIES: hypothetical protein [unclassified Sulfitobacter]MDF3540364.1 hypothetical protein [Sulfitobacter sp. M62]MDF3414405.1 hypothetical protein [Sulfitobacter sp. KE5]MDF3420313.1 hypothetical protein [Sulfitobacter sp. KE43]MDF3432951.1 hypothetical protein [Sulfitobacter sp. KE42]MDF3458591.1 hypothetical protein [Sulfitobacter sp. S74]